MNDCYSLTNYSFILILHLSKLGLTFVKMSTDKFVPNSWNHLVQIKPLLSYNFHKITQPKYISYNVFLTSSDQGHHNKKHTTCSFTNMFPMALAAGHLQHRKLMGDSVGSIQHPELHSSLIEVAGHPPLPSQAHSQGAETEVETTSILIPNATVGSISLMYCATTHYVQFKTHIFT